MSSNAKEWPWPAPVDDGAAQHIIPGTRLPDVALTATRGAPVNLARFQERATIFAYPYTGTLRSVTYEPAPLAPDSPQSMLPVLQEMGRAFE